MGWMFSTDWPTRRALIDDLLSPPLIGTDKKVIRHCCVGNNLWTLNQRVDENGITYRWIILFKLQKHGKNYPYWGYKSIEETCGPVDITCPLSYIDACTEPYNEYSRNWREEVRKYHVGITQKLKPGDCFVLFCRGFKVIEQKRGNRYLIQELDTHALYSLPRSHLPNIQLVTTGEKQ